MLYLDYGAVMVPLFVVPILVARQAFASYLALKESQETTVRTLIGALEAKDPYTAGHAERASLASRSTSVRNWGVAVAIGAPPLRGADARRGKLVVPNHLLNKTGKLTAEEFAQVRMHEEVSVEILTRIDFLAPARRARRARPQSSTPVADDAASRSNRTSSRWPTRSTP